MKRSYFDTLIPQFLALCYDCKDVGICQFRDPEIFQRLHGSTAYEATLIDLRKYKAYQKKVKDLVNYLPLDLQKQFSDFNSGTDKENIIRGIAAFDAEEYKEAVNVLEPLSTQLELKSKVSLFIAISKFLLGDYNAAGYYFQQLDFPFNSLFEEEVDQVIEICEHLSKAKLKTDKKIEDLLYKCMSHKKDEALQF